MEIPLHIQYILYAFGLVFFIWLWLKFSLTRCLFIGLGNIIFGVELIANLTPDSAGITITLGVGTILIIFGLWGLVLWIKQISQQYNDQIKNTESIENWWQTVKIFNIILAVGLLLRVFVMQPFIVEGPSMEKNFVDKEIILVDKISYRLREPIRGEVIIFAAPANPDDDYIKRVIGLPGDDVQIVKGKVYINGQQIKETFLSSSGQTPENAEPLEKKLGKDEYFVLGDNRPHSSDSRDWGVVPKENIIGRAVVSVYPFDMLGLVKIPDLGLGAK